MSTAEFLAKLDKHAHEYNFPALDNAYVDFADFGEDVYFYDNRVYPEGLRPPGRVVASWPADMPILDPASNKCASQTGRNGHHN